MTAPISLTPDQLQQLVGQAVRAALAGPSPTEQDGTADNRIDDVGGSSTEEDPMYLWISKPCRHHDRWRVWFRGVDGKKTYQTFSTVTDAEAFVADNQRRTLKGGGHPIGEAIDQYLASRTDLKPGSLQTLSYRLRAATVDRSGVPVEVFPWGKAWVAVNEGQKPDSQHGIASAIRGFWGWLVKVGWLRRAPAVDLAISGPKNCGKDVLRVDEARRFVGSALEAGDGLALAAATALLTGARAAEVMGLRVRDLDDGGALLWLPGTKTKASRRKVEVAGDLQPILVNVASGRAPTEYLFVFEAERERAAKDAMKQRTDALRRRVAQLCTAAGVPEVVTHALRGTHATIAHDAGQTGHAVASALGQTTFRTTKRHYLAPGTAENANARNVAALIRFRGSQRPEPATAGENAA